MSGLLGCWEGDTTLWTRHRAHPMRSDITTAPFGVDDRQRGPARPREIRDKACRRKTPRIVLPIMATNLCDHPAGLRMEAVAVAEHAPRSGLLSPGGQP